MSALRLYAIACLIAFFAGFLQPVIASWNVFEYFSPAEEQFTELYFEDHLYLPVRIVPFTQYSFRFTLANRTNARREYLYQVWADMEGETLIMDERSVMIEMDQSKTIQESFVTEEEVPNRSKVVVSLPHNNQHISFWMEGSQ